jgi:hypothetical protein
MFKHVTSLSACQCAPAAAAKKGACQSVCSVASADTYSRSDEKISRATWRHNVITLHTHTPPPLPYHAALEHVVRRDRPCADASRARQPVPVRVRPLLLSHRQHTHVNSLACAQLLLRRPQECHTSSLARPCAEPTAAAAQSHVVISVESWY